MTINFTEDQLETLAKSLFIASWIAESGDEESERFAELEQHVLKILHKDKVFPWIEYDKEIDQYYAEGELEEAWISDYIEPHDDETFWQNLENQLANRDAVEEHGEAVLESMEPMERMDILSNATVVYGEEFSENGVRNLRLVK